MDFNQVSASMTHQLLNKNARGVDSDHFYMLFETTLIEIKEYLADKASADTNFFANLFGEWFQDFFTYQNEKSKPFSKDVIVTFSDGSEWAVKALDILALAQNFDVKRKNKERPSTFSSTIMAKSICCFSLGSIYFWNHRSKGAIKCIFSRSCWSRYKGFTA